MKFALIAPILTDTNIEKTVNSVKTCFQDSDDSCDIIFALSGKLNHLFTKIRNSYADCSFVKAFMVDRVANEHKLITIAMTYCEGYDATIIYSGKESVNIDVLNAFISSWKAGNKLVYLRKDLYGFSKIFKKISRAVYNIGISMLGIFKDIGGETDIQLLDQDVVKTINQLPAKNRHLRVLDSFVGYSYDIIELEVDPKQTVNKAYTEKTKDYTISKVLASSFLGASILSLLLAIILPICMHKLKAVACLICVILCVVFGLLALIYNTKRILSLRAGKLQDKEELADMQNRMECYNMDKMKN